MAARSAPGATLDGAVPAMLEDAALVFEPREVGLRDGDRDRLRGVLGGGTSLSAYSAGGHVPRAEAVALAQRSSGL